MSAIAARLAGVIAVPLWLFHVRLRWTVVVQGFAKGFEHTSSDQLQAGQASAT
jgi:hypothetical protein